jgi:uncharacterized protein
MNELRIDVADLLTHPATRRPVHVAATVDGLVVGTARIDAPVDVDLVLERVPHGIVVRGTLRAEYVGECRMCLRPVRGDVAVTCSELYEEHPVDGETYPIDLDAIDLDQLVRDALMLELPLAPACPPGDPDCTAELIIGAEDSVSTDRSTADPPTDGLPADPRWAALSQLEL